jgi:hypothetical protein
MGKYTLLLNFLLDLLPQMRIFAPIRGWMAIPVPVVPLDPHDDLDPLGHHCETLKRADERRRN